MRYAFIEAEKAFASVAWMCKRLGVSPSGFYAWQRRAPSKRAIKDERLKVRIQESFAKSRKTYGSPRIHVDLADEHVGRNRVIRLMQADGLEARASVPLDDDEQPRPAGRGQPARPPVRGFGPEPAMGG